MYRKRLVSAVSALALALGSIGTAVAAPTLTKGKVKSIAAKIVKKQAPTLSVASAKNADTAATCGDAGYLSTEMLLKGGPPRHELESKPVVNHGKPA